MAGKRIKSAYAAFDKSKDHTVLDAVSIIKSNSNVKFDETIELAINLGVDPRHADQMVRGVCNLPNGTGRSVRVAVFAKDAKAEEAKKAGADVVGAEDLMEQIQSGDMPFERVIATPDMMPLVGRLGKVLGPKGTVTMDVTKAITDAKGGAVEFRAEKSGIIHAGVGKASFAEDKLAENVNAFLTAIAKARPSGAKGTFMKSITLTSTMGPGIKIDAAEVTS